MTAPVPDSPTPAVGTVTLTEDERRRALAWSRKAAGGPIEEIRTTSIEWLLARALLDAERRIAEMQESAPCGVCAGAGTPISRRPCICGGTGTEQAELVGLRGALFDADRRIAQLEADALTPKQAQTVMMLADIEDIMDEDGLAKLRRMAAQEEK